MGDMQKLIDEKLEHLSPLEKEVLELRLLVSYQEQILRECNDWFDQLTEPTDGIGGEDYNNFKTNLEYIVKNPRFIKVQS